MHKISYREGTWYCYEKLDHIPSSYIVLMVHVVNIHIDDGPSIAEMKSKTDARLRVSMLQSKEMNSTAQLVQLPDFRSVVA